MNSVEINEIRRYKGNSFDDITDKMIVEKSISIYVNGRHYSSLMYTPGDEQELIIGFLLSQKLISNKADIISIEYRADNIVMVILAKAAVEKFADIMAMTSGCGGGGLRLSLIENSELPINSSKYSISKDIIIDNMKRFNGMSELFKETGGTHGCALFSEKQLIAYKEDIGRHNAVDKVIGAAIMKNIGFDNKIIYTTGRVSADMLIKTAIAGIPIIISHSAPTELAVRLSIQTNITLIGFARGDRFNVYSNYDRIS